MDKSTAFLFFLSLFLMSSCQKQKEELLKPTYANFAVNHSKYNYPGGFKGCKTSVSTYFNNDDESGQTVIFNDEPLEQNISYWSNWFDSGMSIIYRKNDIEGCWSEGEFVFEDDSGDIYTTPFPLDTIGINPDMNLTIKRNEPFELFWEGPPVAENERVHWSLGYAAGAQQDQVGATSLWIMIPDSSTYQNGTWENYLGERSFTLERRKIINNLENPCGANTSGKLEISYKNWANKFTLIE